MSDSIEPDSDQEVTITHGDIVVIVSGDQIVVHSIVEENNSSNDPEFEEKKENAEYMTGFLLWAIQQEDLFDRFEKENLEEAGVVNVPKVSGKFSLN